MKKCTIFLIAGPSGSGKTTLVERLCLTDLGVSRVVTVTTREPRLGETDGSDYYFVSPLTFETMKLAGQFIESTTVYNESYGVPLDAFGNDSDLAVIVTPAGALHLSEILCDTHTVFIRPAGSTIAAERVRRRNAPNALERLRLYDEEVSMADEFQTVIVNEDFDQALQELCMLVVQSRFEDGQMQHIGLHIETGTTVWPANDSWAKLRINLWEKRQHVPRMGTRMKIQKAAHRIANIHEVVGPSDPRLLNNWTPSPVPDKFLVVERSANSGVLQVWERRNLYNVFRMITRNDDTDSLY